MNKMMKSSIYNIFMSGVLVFLSFVSCTDDMIKTSGALQGVDHNRQVEVTLPFGVGRGISTTITTRAAGNGEIGYDSQLSGVMVFVYEAKSENPEENELLAYHLFPIRPTSLWKVLPADGLKTTMTLRAEPSSSISL